MSRKYIYIVFSVLLLNACSKVKMSKSPLAPSQLAVDNYFGVKISDPYRNLENLKDSVVINWMKQQENYTTRILSFISKRDEFVKKLKVTNNDVYF